MRVLQLSLTEVAGMPMRICRALRKIGVVCDAVSFMSISFEAEHLRPTAEALVEFVKNADFIHCHCANTYQRLEKLIRLRPALLHIHGAPERGTGYRPALPHVVATPDLLGEFPGAMYIPNIILPEELPPSAPMGAGPLRIFKSPSLHDKHHALLLDVLRPILARLGSRVAYVCPEKVMAHQALIDLRATCHVSFDHLHGYFGLESLESLAQGLAVINGATPEVMAATREKTGAFPPFHIARTPSELGKTVLGIVQQALTAPLAFDAGRCAGPAYIETHYQPEGLARMWVRAYEEIIATGTLAPDAVRAGIRALT